MKRQMILGLALALAVTVGAMIPALSGAVFADEAGMLDTDQTEATGYEDFEDELEFGDCEVYSPEEEAAMLVKEGVLTESEAKMLNKANSEFEAIYEKYKDVFDKVDAYYESEAERLDEEFYQALQIEEGFTDEQIEQIKSADQRANVIYDALSDNATDAEWEAADKAVEAIYEALDFAEFEFDVEE